MDAEVFSFRFRNRNHRLEFGGRACQFYLEHELRTLKTSNFAVGRARLCSHLVLQKNGRIPQVIVAHLLSDGMKNRRILLDKCYVYTYYVY